MRQIRPWLKQFKYALQRRRWYRPLHLAYTSWRASHRGLPHWKALLENDGGRWRQICGKLAHQPGRVLIATGAAGHLPSLTVESLMGVALFLRDQPVDFLLCDSALPACMMCEINWYTDLESFVRDGPADRCASCYKPGARMLDDAGFNHIGLTSQLSDDELRDARLLAGKTPKQEIASFCVDGVPVGEHAVAGALRFFARGDIEDEAWSEAVLRRYFESALLTYYACYRLFSGGLYKVVVLNHGIYVPQGVIAETARRTGVRVVTWHPAYRSRCFIFNHDETYHHGLLNEPVSVWERMRWSARHEERVTRYLRSRWLGEEDWVKFHSDPELDVAQIQKELGIDFSRPTIGLLTNVVWDAQLHYRANAFSSMSEWLLKTIEYFRDRKDVQLLIRIHPAEVTGTLPSRQLAFDEIRRAFPRLPENVFIIPPESRASTYVAMSRCNAAIIYGTKTGVELTSIGIPVIVAGEAWIRGKGVTLDAATSDDYFRLLDSLPFPARLDERTVQRALKYAYHFFFRRMIPLECFEERNGWPPFSIALHGLSELEAGRLKGLDVVCDGIVDGSLFVYPDEEMNEPPRK